MEERCLTTTQFWRVSLPPFGETIEFLKRGHKFEARWHQGFFLGVKDNTTEKIAGRCFHCAKHSKKEC